VKEKYEGYLPGVGTKYDTCLYNICEENDSEKRVLFDVLAEHELIED